MSFTLNIEQLTLPDQLTHLTQPDQLTHLTLPEQLAHLTQPDQLAHLTQPDHLAYLTQPDHLAYLTQPDHLAYLTQPDHLAQHVKPTPKVLYDRKFGYYYNNQDVRPYVSRTEVSLSPEGVYSLEKEDKFDPDNIIGQFKGYPASLTNLDGLDRLTKLNYGFGFCEGIIYIDQIPTYRVNNGILTQYVSPTTYIVPQENTPPSIFEPQRNYETLFVGTDFDFGTDSTLGSKLGLENKLICGLFLGAPGKYYTLTDPNGFKYRSCVDGFDHASGNIVLNPNFESYSFDQGIVHNANLNHCEFEYWLNCGVLHERTIGSC
jgi:hypothetical protein